MLAKREYSKHELQQKLNLKGYADDIIIQIINQLIKENYQSDVRFAQDFVQMRVNQGKGSVLICHQLKQKGIEQFDFSAFDFFQVARNVRVKKYGEKAPKNYQQKAKQMRFLQSRGFDFEQINQAFESQNDEI